MNKLRTAAVFLAALTFLLTGGSATTRAQRGVSAPSTTPVAAAATTDSVQIGSTGDLVRQVQAKLKGFGYALDVDGVFGPQTDKVVRSWQKSNGLVVDGIAGPATLKSLGLTGVGVRPPAVPRTPVPPRPTQPPVATGLNGLPFAPAGMSGCEEMNFYRIQWGLPQRFDDSGHHQRWTRSDGLGWRESKCQNPAVSGTGCCGGYWQLYISLFLRDGRMAPKLAACDVKRLSDVTGESAYNKQRQACAAKATYDVVGLSAWKPL